MGRLSILEETNVPATPSEGNTLYSTVATPSLLRLKDDAGNVYTLALLEKAQTTTAAKTYDAPVVYASSDLTIASGVITVTKSHHRVDTEAAAATDDLVTINGASATGHIVILRSVAASRDVVVKHGTGNIFLNGSVDFTIGSNVDMLVLMWMGSAWAEIGRGDNA